MTPSTQEEADGIRARIAGLVEEGKLDELREALSALHPSDVADIVESMEHQGARLAVVRVLHPELASEALAEMEEGEEAAQLLAALEPTLGAELLHELADDDAADLIAELDPDERARILAEMPIGEAGELRGLLAYDEESAGGIMTTALVWIPLSITAGEAIVEVRRQGREVEDFYTVYVVDDLHRLHGTVPLDDLILADPDEAVSALVVPPPATVLPDTDQEEVGHMMARYNLASLPVVNREGTLLGRITFDDVLDVLEAEQTEDILRFGGVSEDEALGAGWPEAVRTRLPWLAVNLVTAMVAASVVFLFSHVIENVVILAALMPIIAGMGGNAGTQALAVTVRRLALAHDVGGSAYEVVMKEVLVGLVNGAVLGVVTAGLAAAVGGDPMLGLVVLLAMWGNLVAAGFGGAFIPTVLDRLGVDPAIASSVFLTTLTDLLGFFLLLGLAAALLL